MIRPLALLLLAGCVSQNEPVIEPLLDADFYRCRVEPIVVARCAFFACHGDPSRPYRVFAPNRMRYGVSEAERALAMTPEETELNYRSAIGFARERAGYDEPLFVAKPLDQTIGGAYHEGAELYGAGDVFTDPDDPELAVLREWIAGAREDASCTP